MPLRPDLLLRHVSPRPRLIPLPNTILRLQTSNFTTSPIRQVDLTKRNHYERLNLSPQATPADIKVSFYKLSKAHHPDANRSDPNASETFSLISESYTVLSDAKRRATYDRDVLRIHDQRFSSSDGTGTQPRGSYHSAGGRTASGLSKRRGTFRGPPPSFYRSGGWGTQSEKRRKAHDESTGNAESSSAQWEKRNQEQEATGKAPPGSDPLGYEDEVPHFDKEGHTRTQTREDRRRWERSQRAMGDDDVEFEPQMSLGAHFLIITGILAASTFASMLYVKFMRATKIRKDLDR